MAKETGEVPEELGRMPQKPGAGKRGENLKNKKKYKNKKADPDEADGGFLDIEETVDETNELQRPSQGGEILVNNEKNKSEAAVVEDEIIMDSNNNSGVEDANVVRKNGEGGISPIVWKAIKDKDFAYDLMRHETDEMEAAIEADDDTVKKELPFVVVKAIKDKNFAHDLMKHEMDKLEGRGKIKAVRDKDLAHNSMEREINKKLKKGNTDSVKEMAEDIEKLKNNLGVLISKLNRKLKNFQKLYPNDIEFQNKIFKIINSYKNKVKEFDVIEKNNKETLVKINQLHHELQEWADRDWLKLYERKMERGVSEKETETVLHDLNDADLHGEHSPIKEDINELETMGKIAALEKKHGKIGTNYIKYDKSGFPLDSFTIVGYEVGEDAANSFVVIDRLKGSETTVENDLKKENIEAKISLTEFKKYKVGYRKEIKKADDKDGETEGGVAELSEEEKEELEKFVQEKVSETDKLLSNSEKIFDGIKKGLNEDDYKGIDKRIISCKIGLNNIKNLIAKDSGIYKDTRVLNIVNNLGEKVERLKSDLANFEKIQYEKNITFNEQQKNEMRFIIESFEEEKFLEQLRDESGWSGYREEDKAVGIELIFKAELRLTLQEMGDVFAEDVIIEKAINEIFDILNKK